MYKHQFKNIRDIKNLKGKKVLVRVAYDISLARENNSWVVPNNYRIMATLPTIRYLLKKGASLVFLSWLKRPDGKVLEKYKMDPIAKELAKLIKKPVKKLDDCVGQKVKDEIAVLKPGELLMLENVRFYPEEMLNDSKFSKKLVQGFDLIVFDAFAQSHRIHSSTVGIMKYLPSYAGLLLEKELKNLDKIINNPQKPLTVVLGGAKISDKINVLKSLIKKADNILIGGGLANAFLKGEGVDIGNSYIEDIFVDKAKRAKIDFVQEAKRVYNDSKNIILPFDLVVAEKADSKARTRIIDLSSTKSISQKEKFLDIGPKTIKKYCEIIKKSKTVFWNGPMGVFEINQFSQGTRKIAKAVVESKSISIIGGGDTEKIVKNYHLENKFTHVSTGGGAMLEFLAGNELPALKALEYNCKKFNN